MQTTQPLKTAATVVRWGARLLSAGILLFWGWFLIAHLVAHLAGEGALPSRLVSSDTVVLTAVVVSLVGLAVAWKWELAGGAMTLAAVLIGALFNWRVVGVTSPYILIPFTAAMFVTCWWMNRGAAASTGPVEVLR